MTSIALGQLAWFFFGVIVGAGAVAWFAEQKGLLRPKIDVHIDWSSLKGGLTDEHRIVVQCPVDWTFIKSCLDGAGYVAVPRDAAPPVH